MGVTLKLGLLVVLVVQSSGLLRSPLRFGATTRSLYNLRQSLQQPNRRVATCLSAHRGSRAQKLTKKDEKLRSLLEKDNFEELMSTLAENAVLIKFLRSLAHKKYALNSPNAKLLMKTLSKRLPSMTVAHVAETLWALGALRLRRSPDMLHVMDLALERLDQSRDFLDGKDVTTALVGIARLGLKMRIYPGHFLSSLAGSKGLRVMSSSEVAICIWALGKVGTSWDSLPLALRKAISDAIARNGQRMVANDIANTIYGLSLLRTRWNILPPVVQDTLLFNLQRTIGSMNEIETSNCISGFGRLGCNWASLPPTLRSSFGEAFLRVSKDMGPQGLTMNIHGLGRMNAPFASLPDKIQQGLISKIKKLTDTANDQEIANLIYGLGKMSCALDPRREAVSGDQRLLPLKVKQCIFDAVTKQSWKMTPVGVSNSLWGLMLMKADWNQFPAETRNAFTRAIERQAPRMDEQQIANVVYSFGRLGCKWTSLPASTQRALISAVDIHASDDMVPAGATMTLLGLGRMELMWEQLTVKSQKAISESIQRVLSLCSTRSTSAIIHALSSMGARWGNIPTSLQTNIEEGISRSHWALNKGPSTSSDLMSDVGDMDADERTLEEGEEDGENKREWSMSKLIELEPTSAAAMLLLDAPTIKSAQRKVPQPVDAKNLASFDVMQRREMGLGVSSRKKQPATGRAEDVAARKAGEAKTNQNRHSVSTSHRISQIRAFEDFDRRESALQKSIKDEPHLIESLAKMDASFDSLGYSTRTSIINSLKIFLKSANEKGTVNVLAGLAGVGLGWADINADLRTIVEDAIVRVAPGMAEQGISMTVRSLAKMRVGLNQGHLQETTKAALRTAILRQARLGEHALSNLLYGLGKMTTWKSLHPDIRHSLKQAVVVCHLTERYTPQGVANSLYGLSEMQAGWKDLSTSVRLALAKDAHKVLESTSANQLAEILRSFAKMGVNWRADLSADFQADILLRLESLLQASVAGEVINEHHLSTILYALGTTGVGWNTLSPTLHKLIEDAVHKFTLAKDYSSPQESSPLVGVGTQGLSMIVVGLSRMKADWSRMSPRLSGALKRGIRKLHSLMNASQLAALTSALAKLNFKWDSMKPALKRALLGSLIQQQLKDMSPQEVSMTMSGMGKVGIKWDSDLTQVQRTSLLDAATRSCRSAEAVEVAGMVFGFGMMDCKWDRLPKKFRDILVSHILRVAAARDGGEEMENEEETSFWLMSISGERNLKTKRMCPQATANFMYALSLLVFDTKNPTDVYLELKQVHLALLEQVTRLGPSTFSEREKEQMQIYTHMLRTFVPTTMQQLVDKTSARCLLRADKALTRDAQSNLQRRVVQALSDALKVTCPTAVDPKDKSENLQVVDEFSPFGGAVPVDATIFKDGKPVAFVEVDGPHHYMSRDGSLKLRRKDVMKESLYRRMFEGCSFVRIRYDQVSVYGEAYIGRELANFISIIRTRVGHHDPSYYDTHTEHDWHESRYSDGIVARRAYNDLNSALLVPSRSSHIDTDDNGRDEHSKRLELSMYRSSHLCES